MIIFSSRLVLTLSVINLLVLVGGGLSLLLHDGEQLPAAQTVSLERFLNDMTERQQRSSVQLASLEQRPLFHQNRKQYIVKKAMPVKKQPVRRVNPLTAYKLKGIVYINGGNGFVILLNKNSGKSHKLKTGDSFDGWTVKSILKSAVELTKGAEVAQLKLIKSADSKR